MKIAIVRLSSLGDIVKNASVLPFIKDNLGYEITWISDSKFADVLDYSPFLDRVIKLPIKDLKKNFNIKNVKYLISLLPKNEFDLVIDSHGFIKSALIAKYVSKGKVFGFNGFIKEKLAALFYNKSFYFNCEDNEIYRYNKLFALSLKYSIDINDLYNIPPYLGFDPHKSYNQYDDLLNWHDVIIVIGASKGWEAKKYPIYLWENIIKNLNLNFVILWGNETEKKEAQLLSKYNNVKIAPKMDINDLKYFLSKAKMVVGNDTGPTYIAWSFGIKTIILFGCTDRNLVIENHNTIAIKSNSKVNYCKFDKNDLSIKNISPKKIIENILFLKGN